MIIDALEHSSRYEHLHPLFARAFEFLRTAALGEMMPGRHEIEGDQLFVSIDHVNGRGRDGARVEAHRRYIDIQVAFDGTDEIGWMPLAACRSVDEPFDDTRDVAFWKDRPDTWVALAPGRFAVFFPEDAHAPLGGHGPVRKAILKILDTSTHRHIDTSTDRLVGPLSRTPEAPWPDPPASPGARG